MADCISSGMGPAWFHPRHRPLHRFRWRWSNARSARRAIPIGHRNQELKTVVVGCCNLERCLGYGQRKLPSQNLPCCQYRNPQVLTPQTQWPSHSHWDHPLDLSDATKWGRCKVYSMPWSQSLQPRTAHNRQDPGTISVTPISERKNNTINRNQGSSAVHREKLACSRCSDCLIWECLNGHNHHGPPSSHRQGNIPCQL